MAEPTKVACFEELNLKAIKVSCGKNHTLVLAKDQTGNTRLYSIGKDESNFKNLGCSQDLAKTGIIRKITNLADLEVQDFSASSCYSMIILKGDKKATDGLYEHKLPGSDSVAKGILHAYQKEGKWCYMSEDDYKTKQAELPDVCIAFKCPIPNMENILSGAKPLINVDLKTLVDGETGEEATSSISDEKIAGVFYTASTKVGTDDLKVTLSEQ